ncbi:MAG: sn-glycerol-1-phosphate dehydrogenase [Halanaerobiales bacterium]
MVKTKDDNMKNYLNKTIECECGRDHEIPIKEIIIEEKAFLKIPDVVNKLTSAEKIYLICDKNTYKAAGNEIEDILKDADYKVELIKLEEEKIIPSPEFLFKIMEKIESEGYLIACGSGTINDLTRYLSYKLDRPYLVAATAPSMDGYASSVSSITVDGVKKTYRVNPPEAIIADLSVLKDAPWELIQAGFGDLLGKVTSLMDWKLSKIIFDEYYCQFAVKMVEQELEKIFEVGSDLKNRDIESIEVLIRGLVGSGLAMLMIGSSRPASGSEHHISHFLEMYGLLYDKEIPPHGVKVGIGTYFSSLFYLGIEQLNFENIILSYSKEKRIKEIKKNYKDRARPVLKNLEERWEQEKITDTLIKEKESEIKDLIKNNKKKLKMVSTHLKNTGILEREDVKNLKQDWIKKALNYGFEIRTRYTITTFLKQAGFLRSFSEETLQKFKSEL